MRSGTSRGKRPQCDISIVDMTSQREPPRPALTAQITFQLKRPRKLKGLALTSFGVTSVETADARLFSMLVLIGAVATPA